MTAITITIEPRGNGPDFDLNAAFDVKIDGRHVDHHANPKMVCDLITAALRCSSGHEGPFARPHEAAYREAQAQRNDSRHLHAVGQ